MNPVEKMIRSPEWDRLSDELSLLLSRIFGDEPTCIVIHFRRLKEPARFPLHLHTGMARCYQPPDPPPRRKGAPYHTTDYQLVTWLEHRWNFSNKQRIVIRILWNAWEAGHPEVPQKTLLEAAESDCTALRDLFRENSAWGVLIVRAGPAIYKLAFPLEEEAGEFEGEVEE